MNQTTLLWNLGDGDAWQADPLPAPHAEVRSALATGWPSDATPLFDVTHDATARFYATMSGASPCMFDDDAQFADLALQIPMGYTNLDVYEKRAVVADGALVRLWPEHYRASGQHGHTFSVLIPKDGEHSELILGTQGGLPYPIFVARNLSTRLGLPVLVVRRLESRFWH